MAAPEIAVLLRTCKHTNVGDSSTEFGYALKCDNVSISYTKTPIQVPIPQNSPALIDIGVYRPSISLSGLVDTAPGAASTNNTTDFWDMESGAKTYYIPYKNKLEDFVTDQVFEPSSPIELEFGDASVAISTNSAVATGGAVYLCALQQCRFQVDASKEDRYTFSMQLVVTSRQAD